MLILELLIVLFMFLGPPICTLFGWSTIEGSTSVIKSVHPLLYLLILYAILKSQSFMRKTFYYRNALIVVLIIIVFRFAFNQDITSRLADNVLIPLLFAFFIGEISKSEKKKLACSKWFLFLFVLEIGLAIFERLTNTLVFSYELFNPDDDNVLVGGIEYFRSNSLLGHPLSNALCVAVVLAFIAVSNLKKHIKYMLLVCGFVSLLCFNARFAIVISFSFYFLYYLAKNKLKPSSLVALGSAVLLIFYLIVNFNLGDRLLIGNLKADDTSILARVDIFEMVKRLNSDLLFKGSGLGFVEKTLGILHIENWLLIVIFDLGILVSIYYVYMILKLPLRSLMKYDLYDKSYIFAVFIIIASSNNSLATGVPVIAFIIASSVFIPANSKKIAQSGN